MGSECSWEAHRRHLHTAYSPAYFSGLAEIPIEKRGAEDVLEIIASLPAKGAQHFVTAFQSSVQSSAVFV